MLTAGRPEDAAPLSFGQLSVWRDIDRLPRARWHEANSVLAVDVPPAASCADVRAALHRIAELHPALRTLYHLRDPRSPFQRVVADAELPLEHGETDDCAGLSDVLAGQAFDLTGQLPVRAVLARHPGGRRLLLAKHHIAVDASATAVLEADLRTLLGGGTIHREPDEDLGALAVEQRGASWSARRSATARHFAAVHAHPAADFIAGDPAAGVVQGTLRSAVLHDRVTRRAAEVGVSLSTVVVAAYARAVAARCDGRPVRVGLMSSNRFGLRWRELVTSMNQWVPLRVEPPDAGLDGRALTELHQAALRAYRVAMYDVDAVRPAALGGDAGPPYTCTYNLISPWPDPDRADPAEPLVVWEPVFNAIGPRCYLRVFESPASLTLSLRTSGLGRPITAALLHDIHDLMTTDDEPAHEPGPAADDE
ncbi:MAG: condensation domain-containing protein [Blastococcus sp.]